MNTKKIKRHESTKLRAKSWAEQPHSHKTNEKTIKVSKKQLRKWYNLLLRLLQEINKDRQTKFVLPSPKLNGGRNLLHVVERLVQNLIRLGIDPVEFELHFKLLFKKYEIGKQCKPGNNRRRIITNGEELVMVYDKNTLQIATFYYWIDFDTTTKQLKTWG